MQGGILVVGAGGLGCPVALYLCAAGVGRLGIVDGDTVALSNLHRQIGHSWQNLGESKACSLRRACLSINKTSSVEAYSFRLESVEQAAELMQGYNVVVDCTDAPFSRYLLSDAAIASGRPLVAASAVGLSGQLAVYNFEDGPCLRCAFPTFPGSEEASEPVASCEENGVLGPIVGTVGSLAALEAIKVLAKGTGLHASCLRGRLLLFDALDAAQPFRSLRIRRHPDCVGCSLRSARNPPGLPPRGCPAGLPGSDLVGLQAEELQVRLRAGRPTLLLDVRQPAHFSVAQLKGAHNWPLPELSRTSAEELFRKTSSLESDCKGAGASEEPTQVVCICRRGVDSLRATLLLRQAGVEALNLEGGLLALARVAQEAGFALPALT
ncbi:unnamed protein product [Polarella glacialis]|nr:unnamed protein product [Polarella glacialis]